MPPTMADRVSHNLEAVEQIERALAGISFERYAGDRLLSAGVERLLEIISEASRHVPVELKASEPTVPWQKVADFGNRLRHAYHQVDPLIVWGIVTDDLPKMKMFALRIIQEGEAPR